MSELFYIYAVDFVDFDSILLTNLLGLCDCNRNDWLPAVLLSLGSIDRLSPVCDV